MPGRHRDAPAARFFLLLDRQAWPEDGAGYVSFSRRYRRSSPQDSF
jgi:hypothetical protein